jgi:cytochrome c556
MLRKWTTIAVTLTAVLLTASGLSMADDEDSPLHKLMEKVNAKNNAITKGVRTQVLFKKAQARNELAKAAEELVKLGKEARDATEPAVKQKKSQAEWTKLMDAFIKKSEELHGLVSEPATKQGEAKKAHTAVKATCAACHEVFRVEDDK